METRTPYNASPTTIRPECLLPFNAGWMAPSATELRTACDMAGLTSGSDIARTVGVNPRTVRKWFGGDEAIPFAAWAIVCYKANLGTIWEN